MTYSTVPIFYSNIKQVGWQSVETSQMYCGGSIYSEDVVITAAHCCVGILVDNPLWEIDTDIVAGELSVLETSGYEQSSSIKNYTIHPEYNKTTIQNDVCILYLETPFDLTGKMAKSIELAKEDPQVGTTCDISGWGTLQVSVTGYIYEYQIQIDFEP